MTTALATLSVVAAGMELLGVWLIVKDVRESRQRWDEHQADRQREREALIADPVATLDPMVTRYGIQPWRVLRALDSVETLLSVNRSRQNRAIFLLVGGIVVGLAGSLLGLYFG